MIYRKYVFKTDKEETFFLKTKIKYVSGNDDSNGIRRREKNVIL